MNRPMKYYSNAERQKAYRERVKARKKEKKEYEERQQLAESVTKVLGKRNGGK